MISGQIVAQYTMIATFLFATMYCIWLGISINKIFLISAILMAGVSYAWISTLWEH